jgi:hypothetical protein
MNNSMNILWRRCAFFVPQKPMEMLYSVACGIPEFHRLADWRGEFLRNFASLKELDWVEMETARWAEADPRDWIERQRGWLKRK